ncbi:uncharacterized protein LOC125210473 [Salvia hispanica]|uniref:uncharacterized protein LOC125210473 n=1 Tax=Salvia hispanica TaxID=49212 RepID=UPI002009516A|nr:uncharacterized protein LOC125210473 [Salvia hispanica]
MGAGRKTTTITLSEKYDDPWKANSGAPARNLTKGELGSIVFGCKHSTKKECLDKGLFGLPAAHYSYVKKVIPGLTLFLFNYSDRKLHGVFEAISCGQMNINPNAWITASEGSETTPYPAQVRVRETCRCSPLLEEEMKPIIAKNYYTEKFFWFELDKEQTKGLMALFKPSPWPENSFRPSNADWNRNITNVPPRSTVMNSGERLEMAEARLNGKQQSNGSITNRDVLSPEKKWSELFKPSSSSSAANRAEVSEPEKVLSPSASESESEWFDASASNSDTWGELPPEAPYAAADVESDSSVVECWEDSNLVDSYLEEISENIVQSHDGDTSMPDPKDMPSSEKMTLFDGWGDPVQPEEPEEDSKANNGSSLTLATSEHTTLFDGWGDPVQPEEPEEDSKANNGSSITLASRELNLMDRRVKDNKSEEELQYPDFLLMITKVIEEVKELKAFQFNQNLKTETLELELEHSKQELDELKKRCQKLEDTYGCASPVSMKNNITDRSRYSLKFEMGKGKKTRTYPLKEKAQVEWTVNMSRTARNLTKDKLRAVIFGCKNHTIMECLDNNLFGLPDHHHCYVKNVTPGLTLYLFNYSDRKLHGVFEAVSSGQRNINPRAWADIEGVENTPYPSQVRVRQQRKCPPLHEEEFKPIIASNYYTDRFFWFELDDEQNRRLLNIFLPSPEPEKVPRLLNVTREKFEHLSSSDAYENTVEKIKCGETEDSCTSDSYKDSLGTEKKWSELFKPSSSSCTVTNEEALQCQEVESKSSMTDFLDNEWKFASSSGGWSKLPSEPFLGDRDPCDMRSWKDSAFVENSVEEICEHKVQHLQYQNSQCEDSDSDNKPNMTEESSENNDFSDEEVVYEPSELKERDDTKEIATPGTDLLMIESCERNQGHLNLTEKSFQEDKNDTSAVVQRDAQSSEYVITKLMHEVGVLKLSQVKQRLRIENLEHELVQSKVEIDQLKSGSKFGTVLASTRDNCKREDSASSNLKPEKVFIFGGFDGCSWLSDLSLYSPSKDHAVSLCPMTFIRSHTSLAKLNGELYVFGGSHDGVWYDTVESYNPFNNRWIQRPSLNRKKGSMAGASMYDTIFALGGGNGVEFFSEVELFDLNIGSWLSTEPMLEKRSDAAAADLNGALYVAGGYDGRDYLRSVERFDPRQHAWSNVNGMNLRRGCHSLVAFNEKLYALGGYDGDTMVSSVEVFDPRIDSWMMVEPMKASRGCFGSFVLGGRIYVIGGLQDTQVLDKVECYDEDVGWHETRMKSLGKRSFFSAHLL